MTTTIETLPRVNSARLTLPRVILRSDVASELLGLSTETLRQYRSQGRGPKFHKRDGNVFYLTDDLIAWVTGTDLDNTDNK